MAIRFYNYWSKYVLAMGEARDYIEATAKVYHYAEGDYFARAGEARRFWCFVLSGAVAYAEQKQYADSKYYWVAMPMHYFTGTPHPFTQRPIRHTIIFLQPTSLLLIPSAHFRFAQQRHPPFAELVHVLKQQRMDYMSELGEIRLLPAFEQYATFRDRMPQLYRTLSEPQQICLLRMHRATFYRAKEAYERGNG